MNKDTIKQIRETLGLTQEDFAREIGATGITVSRWERGKAKPSRMAVRNIEALARRAGIAHTQRAA